VANFATHLNVAAFVSGSLAIYLNYKGYCSKEDTYILLLSGIIGGILPDIDHDKSKPTKILEYFFANLIAFLAISKYIGKLPILNIALIWIGSYIAVKILFFIFKKLTTHRGIIHSIPAALIAGGLGIIVSKEYFNFSLYKSYLVGGFIILGYVTHLILDEIYSVDIVGERLKPSFGSAFKLVGEKKSTFFIYIILLFLILILLKENNV